MSTPLTKQTKKICVIVDFDTLGSDTIRGKFAPLLDYLNTNADKYGLILHDLDEREDNSKKIPHLHACFDLKKRKRLSTVLLDVANACGVGYLAVTIDQCKSFEGYFQYLIHKNDPNKYQYPKKDIYTNLTLDEVDMVLDAKTTAIELEDVIAFIKEGHSLLEVMSYCGLSTYQHYRASIQDIYKELERVSKVESGLRRENDLLRHEIINLYSGLNETMQSKESLMRGYVPLKALQEVLNSIQQIKHDHGIGGDTPW